MTSLKVFWHALLDHIRDGFKFNLWAILAWGYWLQAPEHSDDLHGFWMKTGAFTCMAIWFLVMCVVFRDLIRITRERQAQP